MNQLLILVRDEGKALTTEKQKMRGVEASSIGKKLWMAISRLFTRPWCNRVWVLQEVMGS